MSDKLGFIGMLDRRHGIFASLREGGGPLAVEGANVT